MEEQITRIVRLGYKVIPLAKNKKLPLIAEWTTKASSDESVITAWEDSFPGCNWGLATGRISGVIVIDIDPRHGGDISWRKLTEGKTIKTSVCKTGGGGEHYYFKVPNSLQIKNAVLTTHPGIDIRGDGGQVVIPPSTHQSGLQYTWQFAPWDVSPAEIPDWLLKIISTPSSKITIGQPMVEGHRNDSIFHQALGLARQDVPIEFTILTMKTWRDSSHAKDFPDDEIEKTVESAYKRAEQEKVTRKTQTSPRTDSDNADRMVKLYSDRIKYAPGFGWIVWNGKAWVPDDEDARVINLATESMITMRDEAAEEMKTPENFKAALVKINWSLNSLNIGRLRAAVKLASTRDIIRTTVESLDPSDTKFFLNVKNGVINLRNGELMPHDPKYMLTKIVDIDYNPDAKCPFWEKTIQLAFNHNQNLASYLKRAIGYSITGSTAEQCLFICWGEQGNNGKSTILETLQHLLTPYAQMSDMKVLTSADMDNRVASSLARLPGVRLVSMNEADENQRLSEALVKQITGGDALEACKKFHEPFEFLPSFKLWVRTNEKPIIRGSSDAIWRRIKLIPFETPIPQSQRKSRDIVDDILKTEAEGILAWCVQGAIEWCAGGLQDPEEVKVSTAGYRTDMDLIAIFFNECVEESASSIIPVSELYQVFSHWCRENGVRFVFTAQKFNQKVGQKLQQNGEFLKNGKRSWKGIVLSEYAKNSLIM